MKYKSILKSILALIISVHFISCTPISNDKAGQRESINFDWKFKLGEDNDKALFSDDDTDWKTLNLPHDWGVEGRYKEDGGDWQTGYLSYGIGYYKKSISYNPDWKNKQVFIDFDGVYVNSTVYVNDKKIGFYPNGYLGFSYNITSYLKEGENVIAVKVDNEKGKNENGQPEAAAFEVNFNTFVSGMAIEALIFLAPSNFLVFVLLCSSKSADIMPWPAPVQAH